MRQIFKWLSMQRGRTLDTSPSYHPVPTEILMAGNIGDEEAGPAGPGTPRTGANSSIPGPSQAHLDGTVDDVEIQSTPPTPRFMQDEAAHRRRQWIPTKLRRYTKAVVKWSKGPEPPRRQAIKPWLPFIQEAPIRLLDTYVPKRKARIALLLFFYLCWSLTFGLTMQYSTSAAEIKSFGRPTSISCGATYWASGNKCGLDGSSCRPFDGESLAFRCPASCSSYMVLNPRAVGAQEIVYQSFVIGGPPDDSPNSTAIYRGDSFICQAAIHAGVIGNSEGGCGVVAKTGNATSYSGSRRHGIPSVGFDSHFPLSFAFESDISCSAKDMRWPLLAITVGYSVLLSLFTTSPGVFFSSSFTGLFLHVSLASDPPPHRTMADLFSNLIGRFLPAAFVAYVLYIYCIRRSLLNLTAQVEKTILWLGGAWVGALTNYTFDFIPIQRLTPHDLAQQPGAKAALAAIVILLLFIVVQQIWYFRLEGRLRRYLAFYLLLVLGVVVCIVLPNLNLRIHHYILALLLLPGTSMQTRPSLLYQGILVGLFVNGIARWGFDSLLQTDLALQGDAQHNSGLPSLLPPVIAVGAGSGGGGASNISFAWVPPVHPFDGVSVLVNDVERYRGYVDDAVSKGSPAGGEGFFWEREAGAGESNEYFRFAYLQGSETWDYTRAGIWSGNGSWVEMAAGPSKRRRREVNVGGLEGEGGVREEDR